MSEFETWWYHEGSAFRPVDEDIEEFSKRMCQLAWKKSQEAEREVCAKACEAEAAIQKESAKFCKVSIDQRDFYICAAAIRARNKP